MNYHLYADESGDFRKPADAVVVCALMLPSAVAGLLDAQRLGAEAFAPEVPWPWHAAHLNQPVSWALWHAHRPVGQSAWHAAAEAIRPLLVHFSPREWQVCMDALRAGRRPPMAEVKTLGTRALAVAHAELDVLCQRARAVREWLDQALLTAAAHSGVFAVASFEDGGPQDGDRYLQLLQVALARSADALLAPAFENAVPACEVLLHVQGRHVTDPVLGVPTPLGQRHLHEAAAAATGTAERRLVRHQRSVRLVPADVPAYDQHVVFAHVLTDRLANRTRRALRVHASDSSALHDVCRRVWGGTSAAASARLLFAPGGPEFARISALRRGDHVAPSVSVSGWHAEASAQWLKEL